MMDCGTTILIFLALLQAACGQTLTVEVPSAVERGRDTVFTCTGGASPYIFRWEDVVPAEDIFIGGEKVTDQTKYMDFSVSENGNTSIMTITNTQIEDEGKYRCAEGLLEDSANFTVEVQSTRSLSVESRVENNIDMYEATCELLGGRPDETISYLLGDDPAPCEHPEPTYLPSDPGLFSKTSTCKFQATADNNGQTLKCVIGGHQVTELDGEETKVLNLHSAPGNIVTLKFESLDPNLRVTCDIDPANQPTPAIRNYYIYVNDTLKHASTTGDNSVELTESEYDLLTEFECVAGNYLGNTTSGKTSYDPKRTTTPPTIAPITTEPVAGGGSTDPGSGMPTDSPLTTNSSEGGPGEDPKAAGLSGGEIAGIVVGAIIFITIIIVLIVIFVVKPDCIGGSGSPNTTTTHKHSTSAVGSSNGNEKEKIRPEAAPRGHSSIKHTTDNPQQAEYAMVDRKPGGRGDSTDARGNGAGQNEQPGMHYADLDLTPSAGHSDRVVPKNEDGVVVYSSILV